MATRAFTLLLLFTFGLSILLFPILEAGHEVLHHIENEFHHHDADHHHTIADHHVKDHHHDDEEADEEDLNASGLLSFYAGFFNQTKPIEIASSDGFQQHHTLLICLYTSPILTPPSTPPLF